MTATVIVPTTGASELRNAIESVLNQTYETICYLVIDGDNFSAKAKTIASDYMGNKNLKICSLPINVGANGFYGHRVYAAFSHLINTKYVLYLDQDNWFEKNHVQSCVETIEKNNLDWSYSLRKVANKEGEYVCNDDCESLGKWQTYHGLHHIDTNCYCVKSDIVIKLASVWHGGWGQDRVFFNTISNHFKKFDCTGEYTVNYRVDGNPGSVTSEFFLRGNEEMKRKHNGVLPWRKI